VLFETYHHRIYRDVLGLVKNPAEAEGLTRDTFFPPIVMGTCCAIRSRSRPGYFSVLWATICSAESGARGSGHGERH